MILNFFMYLKLSFGITLLLAAVAGDVIHVWYEDNMFEEFLIIATIVFATLAVIKMKQLKRSGE